MMARSYKALPPRGESPVAQRPACVVVLAAGLAVAALPLAGCSLNEPDDFATASTRPFTTGADPAPGTLAATDIAAISTALAETTPTVGSEAKWENPVTGSAGRVTQIETLPKVDGRDCRSFSTTVNGLGGLTALTGIGCRGSDGAFVIEGLAPKA